MSDDRENTKASQKIQTYIAYSIRRANCKGALWTGTARVMAGTCIYLATGCLKCTITRVHSSGRGQLSTNLLAHLGFKHTVSCHFRNKCKNLCLRYDQGPIYYHKAENKLHWTVYKRRKHTGTFHKVLVVSLVVLKAEGGERRVDVPPCPYNEKTRTY